jgi:hypothetical protein
MNRYLAGIRYDDVFEAIDIIDWSLDVDGSHPTPMNFIV